MPGIPGAPEPQGQQGEDGARGEPGVKGPRGIPGTRGLKGNPGIKGVKGEQGSKGEKGEIVNSAVSQTNWKQCVWKNEDGRDSGKIKVQKYLENAMKNKLSGANLSWPSLKETFEKYRQTKNIN